MKERKKEKRKRIDDDENSGGREFIQILLYLLSLLLYMSGVAKLLDSLI